jgi:hypothetical protein
METTSNRISGGVFQLAELLTAEEILHLRWDTLYVHYIRADRWINSLKDFGVE